MAAITDVEAFDVRFPPSRHLGGVWETLVRGSQFRWLTPGMSAELKAAPVRDHLFPAGPVWRSP